MARESWRLLRLSAGSPKLVASVLGLGVAYQVLAVIALILVGKTLAWSFPSYSPRSRRDRRRRDADPGLGGRARDPGGGFVLLLGEAGIDAADATLISLLSAAVVLLAGAGVAGASYLDDAAASAWRSAARYRGGGPPSRT